MNCTVKWDQRSNCVKYVRRTIRIFELNLVDICYARRVLTLGRFVTNEKLKYRFFMSDDKIFSIAKQPVLNFILTNTLIKFSVQCNVSKMDFHRDERRSVI